MGLAMAQQLLKPHHTVVCIARHSNPDLTAAAMASDVALEQWQQDLSRGQAAAEHLRTWLK